MSQRPVELTLRSGERVRGLLVFEGPGHLALEVEGRALELRREEVVAERNLDHDPSWLERQGPSAAPLLIETLPLGTELRSEGLRSAFSGGAHVLYLPSRAPQAWDPELAPTSGGPFPLWEPQAGLPLMAIPHLLRLEGSEQDRLLEELEPEDAIFLESAAPTQALARFLAQLRWAYVGGRRLGLRFYDPRVLEDLWAELEPAALALLFGAAWTRSAAGPDDLACVLCDASLPALRLACSACGAKLLGEERSPSLIGSYGLRRGEALLRARAWPPGPAREPLVRPLQRGRKALVLQRQTLARLGAAFRRRVQSAARGNAEGKT